ncbi:hypothetical protein KCU77_g26, partial [Aureobasidium melanogenum]
MSGMELSVMSSHRPDPRSKDVANSALRSGDVTEDLSVVGEPVELLEGCVPLVTEASAMVSASPDATYTKTSAWLVCIMLQGYIAITSTVIMVNVAASNSLYFGRGIMSTSSLMARFKKTMARLRKLEASCKELTANMALKSARRTVVVDPIRFDKRTLTSSDTCLTGAGQVPRSGELLATASSSELAVGEGTRMAMLSVVFTVGNVLEAFIGMPAAIGFIEASRSRRAICRGW